MAELKKTSIYLDADLDAALAARAAEDGVTKAELIRTTLSGAVSRPKRPRMHIGIFSSGLGDLATNHDKYLGEGLDAEFRRREAERRG